MNHSTRSVRLEVTAVTLPEYVPDIPDAVEDWAFIHIGDSIGYGLRFRPSDIRELEEKGYVPAPRTGRKLAANGVEVTDRKS